MNFTPEKLDSLEEYLTRWFDSAFRNEDKEVTRHHAWFIRILALIDEHRKLINK